MIAHFPVVYIDKIYSTVEKEITKLKRLHSTQNRSCISSAVSNLYRSNIFTLDMLLNQYSKQSITINWVYIYIYIYIWRLIEHISGGLLCKANYMYSSIAVIVQSLHSLWLGDAIWRQWPWWTLVHMMTSSNGNIFRVTGHLCGKFTGPRWISRTKASDAELWCFLWFTPE